jgi:hypothetical protein
LCPSDLKGSFMTHGSSGEWPPPEYWHGAGQRPPQPPPRSSAPRTVFDALSILSSAVTIAGLLYYHTSGIVLVIAVLVLAGSVAYLARSWNKPQNWVTVIAYILVLAATATASIVAYRQVASSDVLPAPAPSTTANLPSSAGPQPASSTAAPPSSTPGPSAGPRIVFSGSIILAPSAGVDLEDRGRIIPDQTAADGPIDLYYDLYLYANTDHPDLYISSGSDVGADARCRTAVRTQRNRMDLGYAVDMDQYCFLTSEGRLAWVRITFIAPDRSISLSVRVWDEKP